MKKALVLASLGLGVFFSIATGTTRDSQVATPPPPRCDLSAAVTEIEAQPTTQRIRPALQGFASCPGVLEGLAEAAARAAEMPRGPRSATLGEAAQRALPSACSQGGGSFLDPASNLAWSCPPPQEMGLSEGLLKDLDAGTYLYVLAVQARLRGADQLDASAARALDNLVLAAALEGEAARESAH